MGWKCIQTILSRGLPYEQDDLGPIYGQWNTLVLITKVVIIIMKIRVWIN